MTTHIFKIPVDAPIWNKTPEDILLSIVKKLSDASYHYADDSASEWGRGKELIREAATLCNQHKLSYSACLYLYSHKTQLVSFEQFMDAILNEARK